MRALAWATTALAAAAASSAAAPAVPAVALSNAAAPGLTMPAIGLGTGAYSDNAAVGYGAYPECWSSTSGCGAFARQAVGLWLAAGGRRIDAADSYQNQGDVGAALAASGVPRGDIFLLSKVGPSQPLGYNDTLAQFAKVKADMGVDYVDALLVHWPWDSRSQGNVTQNTTQSTDPLCNHTSPTYNEAGCRLSTWRAMLAIFASGGARSIGVSNYNVSHLQEIADAGMPMPAINQVPFHLYRSSTQMDVLAYCARHGVTLLGYSPFGVPDYHSYPAPLPAANQLQHPAVVAIAAKYGVTPAQVLIRWQWALGVPVNPRSMSAQHMADNLAAYAALPSLNQTEVNTLSSQPQVTCDVDPKWCVCAVAGGVWATRSPPPPAHAPACCVGGAAQLSAGPTLSTAWAPGLWSQPPCAPAVPLTRPDPPCVCRYECAY